MSVEDTARYYLKEAGNWERQVLIRSRAVAGDAELFKSFFAHVESAVFSENVTVESALNNVRQSKQKIDLEHQTSRGTDVKLGTGGIREIEFIAQALQLAYGGQDRWLRAPHTLISLSRLADRGLISETELTQLFEAYDFLRHLEHILQMENGLQTHLVPNDPGRRALIGRKMGFAEPERFESALEIRTGNVNRIFQRIFGEASAMPAKLTARSVDPEFHSRSRMRKTLAKSGVPERTIAAKRPLLEQLADTSPHFSQLLLANPQYVEGLRQIFAGILQRNHSAELCGAVMRESDFGDRLAVLRRTWGRFMLEIVMLDVLEQPEIKLLKRAQTSLAEASIDCAIGIVKEELARRYSAAITDFPFAVLGLGKIGGAGLDYESDLDIVLVYDESVPLPVDVTNAEFYSRAAELFVTVLSSITRDGQLYRVDLRLRPYGKNGTSAVSRAAFAEYMGSTAAIWELLAYLKLRGVGGNRELARSVESEIRGVIHQRADAIDPTVLAAETSKMRLRLEHQKAGKLRGRDIDIKYGAGGMLDVYFAVRYLQLRDNVPEDESDRSTDFMLAKLHGLNSLADEQFAVLYDGYRFLSQLDHNLRLTVGRSTRLPMANAQALETIAHRMGLASAANLVEALTLHRLQIRDAFEQIVVTTETAAGL
jgi:glutamate-ammonia-ligase adenylyltransferase